MALTQADRLIRIFTPLGDDVLVVRSFEGSEEISALYEYRVLCASENPSIAAKSIVGQRVTLAIYLSDGKTDRYIDGFVAKFSKQPRRAPHRVYYEYELRVVPWLWFLNRTTDCRIFQQKSVPDVIQKIFDDLGFKDYSLKLQGSHQPWDYCVQYRETAFNFISHLMEKEGIYYFFKHEKGKHTLILGDYRGVHQNCDFKSTVKVHIDTTYTRDEDMIDSWERHYSYRSGKWAQQDYNFETPSTSLMANEKSILEIQNSYEFYDYPGEYDNRGDGSALTKLRMEEEEAPYDTATGDSDCRFFTPGYKFELQEHEQADQNSTYVLLSVTHRAQQGALFGGESNEVADYSNSFTCFPASVQYRSPRNTPLAIVHGTQTALVVGPAGEEIFTDKYGRVKVQFYWDREGKKDDKSSCWIRVSQPWAGKAWGAMWIPRIGQEVVVDFEEGDPNRPLIVGRVYNAEQTVPYTLPANSTQSGFKSNSSKGGGGFNELRFEDKKGNEEWHEQAEKDMTILVKHDRTEHVMHDETITIDNNRTEKVGVDEKITIGNNRTEEVGVKESGKVGQEREWKIGQKDTLNVGQEIDVQAGMKISIQAGATIEITCGASSIKMNPGMITIQAPMVKIN